MDMLYLAVISERSESSHGSRMENFVLHHMEYLAIDVYEYSSYVQPVKSMNWSPTL